MMPRLAPANRPVGPFRLSTHPTGNRRYSIGTYIRKRPIMSLYLALIPLLTSTCYTCYAKRKRLRERIRDAVIAGGGGGGWSQIDNSNNTWDSFNLIPLRQYSSLPGKERNKKTCRVRIIIFFNMKKVNISNFLLVWGIP
jgi:hypothetical protein